MDSRFDDSALNKVLMNNQELVVDNIDLQSINDIGEPTELMPLIQFSHLMFDEHAEEKMVPYSSVDNKISTGVQQHDLVSADHEDD